MKESRSEASGIYEDFKLCPRSGPNEVCFVLERYESGHFVRVVHEHIPKSRISNDRRLELLRALVLCAKRSADDELPNIVGFFLNARGKNPIRRELPVRTAYPEPSVLRTYCGTNVLAWSDQVVSPTGFRKDLPCNPA